MLITKVAFLIIVFGTVLTLTSFASWVTKVSLAGARRESVVRRTWGLALVFAIMAAAGAWDLFVARHPLNFVNWPLLICGCIGVLQMAASSVSARKNYGEAEMRKVMARDI